MKVLKLKSTRQVVFPLPFVHKGKNMVKEGYTRVLIPHKRTKKGRYGQVVTVKNSSIYLAPSSTV